jgi:predicted ATP-grasp superfamily ATP-dependent carboligase
VCADDFGDADLHQVAEVLPGEPSLRANARGAPTPGTAAHLLLSDAHPWWRVETAEMQAAGCGPRLGCSFAAHQTLHNPLQWSPWLQSSNLPVLDVLPGESATADQRSRLAQGAWLHKPLRSGGGRGIRHWTGHAPAVPLKEPSYFQQFQTGEPLAALFLARCGVAELLGVTRQLIGDATAAPPWPFGYCGSIGPVTLPETARATLEQIAATLTAQSGVCGLFGIDFIWDGCTPWAVEVNPRYTASCEILELTQRRALLAEQWRACLPDGNLPTMPASDNFRCGAAPAVLGKLIVYARQPVVAPDFSRFLRPRSPWSIPYLADLPRLGVQFVPGQPVCTVFASGEDVTACHRKLVRRAKRVRRWLGETG